MQPVGSVPKRCAYCHEPLCFTDNQVQALPVGDRFVCNEFCAQALREEAHLAVEARLLNSGAHQNGTAANPPGVDKGGNDAG